MNYRTLTANEGRVSTLALGGNIFGYACDEAETCALLHEAESLGVNFVDTADVYSDGRSEEMIGRALVGRRDRWVIATKVGVKSDATGHGIGAKKLIFERIEQSLRRLRTDYIDLYQLHHFDPITPPAETLDAFATLRAQGKVRHFGLSNCTAPQAHGYIAAADLTDCPPPATNQIHYNLLKRRAEEEFLAAPPAGQPRLLVYGALGRGVLSGKYRAGETPAAHSRAALSARVQADLQPAVLAAVAGLETIARAADLTMSQLATAYVLRAPAVVAALVGLRTNAQLREIAAACSREVSPETWAAIDAFVARLAFDDQVSLGQPALNAIARTESSSHHEASTSIVFHPRSTRSTHLSPLP